MRIDANAETGIVTIRLDAHAREEAALAETIASGPHGGLMADTIARIRQAGSEARREGIAGNVVVLARRRS